MLDELIKSILMKHPKAGAAAANKLLAAKTMINQFDPDLLKAEAIPIRPPPHSEELPPAASKKKKKSRKNA